MIESYIDPIVIRTVVPPEGSKVPARARRRGRIMGFVLATERLVTLREGTVVEIRAMEPTDAGRLVRFHESLSPETTRLRYFTFHAELRPEELHRFTHVDHLDREALVATRYGEIIGVARFDRTADTARADVAFVVADDYQGRGLGSVLLRALVRRARDVGIDTFTAETLPENVRMLKVFRHSGIPSRSRFEDGTVHVVLDLSGQRAGGAEWPDARVTFGPAVAPARRLW
jgi:RimJ/RimL family protein N-acetyltransferase